jgi:hypothetical protein
VPRDLRAHENQKRTKARRDHALARLDLRKPTTPRESAAGPMSHAVKVMEPEAARAIEVFLASKKGDKGGQ